MGRDHNIVNSKITKYRFMMCPFLVRREHAELLHEKEQVRHAPVLGDLAVMNTHRIHGVKVDSAAGRRDPEERPLMSTVIGLESRYDFPVGRLPMVSPLKGGTLR